MYLAYLDPGTGSYLVAAIVGGFAGAMVVVKTWGRRVLTKLGLRRSTAQPPVAEPLTPPGSPVAKIPADPDR